MRVTYLNSRVSPGSANHRKWAAKGSSIVLLPDVIERDYNVMEEKKVLVPI